MLLVRIRSASLRHLEWVPTTYIFMENWRKLSYNYHQILPLNNSSENYINSQRSNSVKHASCEKHCKDLIAENKIKPFHHKPVRQVSREPGTLECQPNQRFPQTNSTLIFHSLITSDLQMLPSPLTWPVYCLISDLYKWYHYSGGIRVLWQSGLEEMKLLLLLSLLLYIKHIACWEKNQQMTFWNIFSYFSLKIGDNLHEMSKPIFWEKIGKISVVCHRWICPKSGKG